METFRRTITGWKSSSLGYEVKGASRSLVKYRDRFGTLDVKAEALSVAPYGYVLYVEDIPDQAERTRQEILDRIGRAFDDDEAFVEFFPDANRAEGLTLAPWLRAPVEDSDVSGKFKAWENAPTWSESASLVAQEKQLETLWGGVSEWAELVQATRVIVEPPIPQRGALKELGFERKGFPGASWLEWHTSPEQDSIRTVLNRLPEHGPLRLTFSIGHEILCVVSGDWRLIGVQPPSGDVEPHLAFFRSLLADVEAAGEFE